MTAPYEYAAFSQVGYVPSHIMFLPILCSWSNIAINQAQPSDIISGLLLCFF